MTLKGPSANSIPLRQSLPSASELFGRAPIVDPNWWTPLLDLRSSTSAQSAPFPAHEDHSSFSILAHRASLLDTVANWLRLMWALAIYGFILRIFFASVVGLESWPSQIVFGLSLATLLFLLMRALFSRFELIFSLHHLTLRRHLFFLTWGRSFDLKLVRRLRHEPFGKGTLAFDHGPDTVRFTTWLGKEAISEFLAECERLYTNLEARGEAWDHAGPKFADPVVPLPRLRHSSRYLDGDRLLITLPSEASLGNKVVLALLLLPTGLLAVALPFAKSAPWLLKAFFPMALIFLSAKLAWYQWGYEEIELSTTELCHRAKLWNFARQRRLALSEIKSIACGIRWTLERQRKLPSFLGRGTLECWMGDRAERMFLDLEEGETQLIVEEIHAWLGERGAWPPAAHASKEKS